MKMIKERWTHARHKGPQYHIHIWQTPEARIEPLRAGSNALHLPAWFVAMGRVVLGARAYFALRTICYRLLEKL